MPVLCFGPVCIPLNLLLPFLLGVAHHYGWLRWIKREWVTFTYWRQRFTGRDSYAAAGWSEPADAATGTTSATQQAAGQRGDMEYECQGDVCRLVPVEEFNRDVQQQKQHSNKQSSDPPAATSTVPGDSTLQRRKVA